MPVGVVCTELGRRALSPCHALHAQPPQILVFLQATRHDTIRKTLPFQKVILINNANPSPL